MSTLAVVQQTAGDVMEEVIAKGDLKDLNPAQRARYYVEVCTSMGLNPLTKPFDYITLNGKLTLYATKSATDQLRTIRGVTISIDSRERIDDLYVVTATAHTPDGREDSDIGAVNIKGLAGDNLANAMMKATTKAKRRVTLSLCGLGWVDESEVDSIANVRRPVVDTVTGEIIDDSANIRELRTKHQSLTQGNEVANEDQFKRIAVLAKELGLKTKAEIQAKAGKPVNTLTPNEADFLIGEMESELRAEDHRDDMDAQMPGVDPYRADRDLLVGSAGDDRYTS